MTVSEGAKKKQDSIVISVKHKTADTHSPGGGGGYSHTLPVRVCAAQRGCDFEAPDLERGTHFRGVS